MTFAFYISVNDVDVVLFGKLAVNRGFRAFLIAIDLAARYAFIGSLTQYLA